MKRDGRRSINGSSWKLSTLLFHVSKSWGFDDQEDRVKLNPLSKNKSLQQGIFQDLISICLLAPFFSDFDTFFYYCLYFHLSAIQIHDIKPRKPLWPLDVVQGVPTGSEAQKLIANETTNNYEKMYFAPKNCFLSLFWSTANWKLLFYGILLHFLM